MRLTHEQLFLIEKALNEKCNFSSFDDVRTELTDHIASEIEHILSENECTFEQAFVKVMTRWNPFILPRSNAWYNNVPYIINILWQKLDCKFQFSAIPATLLITYLLIVLQERNYSVYQFVLPVLLLGVTSTLFLLYRKCTNQVNSTLSIYALHKIYTITTLMFIILVLNIFLFKNTIEEYTTIIYWSTVYTSLLITGKAWVMRKHLKIENQLLKVIE